MAAEGAEQGRKPRHADITHKAYHAGQDGAELASVSRRTQALASAFLELSQTSWFSIISARFDCVIIVIICIIDLRLAGICFLVCF